MSNTTNSSPETPLLVSDRSVRRALLAELPVSLRRLHVSVLADTLANGVPVRPAALAVVLSAHDDLAEACLRFTSEHVNELLWCGIAEFCEDYGIAMPDGCAEALYSVLATASASGILEADSDAVADLFAAFRELAAS
jgi:hypothetical protein